MHQYMIFAGDFYYPMGGWGDFRGFADDLDEAIERCETDEFKDEYDWAHIVEPGHHPKVVWHWHKR